ncbi:MAG: hypothetical protein OWQ54_10205 [Sulfolobaceae archaeon]|nr:hypothetical protein [Sulfolobaceae archaeon]
MTSQKTCLFYIAGDITRYSLVDYKFGGNTYKSFFSAHALWCALNPDKVVALLPDSLITTDCSDSVNVIKNAYKEMLREKAKQLQFSPSSFNDFLNKLEIEYIPNVGIANNSMVADCQGNLKTDDQGKYITKPNSTSRSPTFIYNTIYAIMNKYSKEFEEFVIDLTHGTNVLISALLTASAMFRARLYAAPIMGPPNGVVEIVELTDLVEAMKDSLKISLSIEKLDERHLVDYTLRLKSLNPTQFGNEKDLINRIKSTDLNKVSDFLWNLRNGFVVNALKSMNDLQQYLSMLKSDVSSLSKIYEEWYKYVGTAFQNNNQIILSNFYSTLNIEGTIDSLKGSDDIKTMLKILGKYIDVDYYDKALSLGRELPVAECLSNHGGGKFDDNDINYKNCSELVTTYITLNHSELLTYRNHLMHSGLSEDLKVEVKDRKVQQRVNINRKNIINYVKGELKNDIEIVRRIV